MRFSAQPDESMMLSEHAESVILSALPAESRGSVTAKIGFSVDSDLHEKPLHRIGSRWCQNHIELNLYVFVSVQFFFVFRSE